MLRLLLALVAGALCILGCPPANQQDGGRDGALSDGGAADGAGADASADASCGNACAAAGLTVRGECNGTTLRYCEGDCIFERNCATLAGGPFSCGDMDPGSSNYYECLAAVDQPCEPHYSTCNPAGNCSTDCCNGNPPCDPGAATALVCSPQSTVCVVADGGVRDGAVVDATLADTTRVDAAPRDIAQHDAWVADSRVADAALGDSHGPDTATTDTAVADHAGTDSAAAVDHAASDSWQPDAAVDAGELDVPAGDGTADSG